MRLRTVYTSVLIGAACCAPAEAAKNVEILRYPSLLMFGGTSQTVGVSYSFAQHSTPSSSSSASSLRESYMLGTTAAILDPHLVYMQLIGGVSYSQNFDDRTSTLLNGEYNLVASLFDTSYHPVVVSSFRTTSVIANGYTPSYSLTSNNNQFSATLLNKIVPVKVLYMHTTSETDRLDVDSESVSDALSIAVDHEYEDISDTRFLFSHSRSRTQDSDSRSYSISLGNYLSLDKEHRYRLSSSADIFDSDSEGIPQRNVNLSEELNCIFGKALTGSLSERFSYNTTQDFDNNKQTVRSNTVSAALSHSLYRSLTTTVSGSMAQGEVAGGTTSTYVVNGRANYVKVLPAHSSVSIALDGSRNVTSQDLPVSELAARDEVHRGVNWGDRIEPDREGTLQTVVAVKSFNQDPELTYVEGVDYRVDFALGEIEILFGGGIVPGTDISISYTVLVNPSIRYQTDSIGASGNLSMFSGRYTLNGNISKQDQALLSGDDPNQGLVSSTSMAVRLAANYNPTQFGVEYGRVDSSQEESSHIDAFATHSLRTEDDSLISMSLRESYSMTEATGGGTESTSQNTVSLTASYSRRFFRWLNFNSSCTASDSRSDRKYSQFVSVRGMLSGMYNQLQFSLNTQTLFRITGSGTTRDTNVTASVTRSF